MIGIRKSEKEMMFGMFNDWVWHILKERESMGLKWTIAGGEYKDSVYRFTLGDLLAVEFTCFSRIWMRVWVSHKTWSSVRVFDEKPKSIMLKWNKCARETAHNAVAIIELIVHTIEKMSEEV